MLLIIGTDLHKDQHLDAVAAGAPTAPRSSTDAPDLTPGPRHPLRMILTLINHCDWCRDHLRQPAQLHTFSWESLIELLGRVASLPWVRFSAWM